MIVDGAQEFGYQKLSDFNGKDSVGFGISNAQTRNSGHRITAKSFLAPAKDRPNLHIAKISQVIKILIHRDSKKTRGVQFRRKEGGMFQPARVIIR
jgi:choline dehydrogenase